MYYLCIFLIYPSRYQSILLFKNWFLHIHRSGQQFNCNFHQNNFLSYTHIWYKPLASKYIYFCWCLLTSMMISICISKFSWQSKFMPNNFSHEKYFMYKLSMFIVQDLYYLEEDSIYLLSASVGYLKNWIFITSFVFDCVLSSV